LRHSFGGKQNEAGYAKDLQQDFSWKIGFLARQFYYGRLADSRIIVLPFRLLLERTSFLLVHSLLSIIFAANSDLAAYSKSYPSQAEIRPSDLALASSLLRVLLGVGAPCLDRNWPRHRDASKLLESNILRLLYSNGDEKGIN
jgi:hypothetical protein